MCWQSVLGKGFDYTLKVDGVNQWINLGPVDNYWFSTLENDKLRRVWYILDEGTSFAYEKSFVEVHPRWLP